MAVLCYTDLSDNSILDALLKFAFQEYRKCNDIWDRIDFVLDEFRKDLRNRYDSNISAYNAVNELNRRLAKIKLPFVFKFRIHTTITNEIISGFQLTNGIWYRPTNIASNDMFYFEILPTFTTFFKDYTYKQWMDFKNILKGLLAYNLFQMKAYDNTKMDEVSQSVYNRFNVSIPFAPLSYTNSILELENLAKQTLQTLKNGHIHYFTVLDIINNEKKNAKYMITFTDATLNQWVQKKFSNWKVFVNFLGQYLDIYYNTLSPTGGIFTYN